MAMLRYSTRMARFVGVIATDNGEGGVYTNNPQSEFIDVVASGNRGPGVYDDSGRYAAPPEGTAAEDVTPASPPVEPPAVPSKRARIAKLLGSVGVGTASGALGNIISG